MAGNEGATPSNAEIFERAFADNDPPDTGGAVGGSDGGDGGTSDQGDKGGSTRDERGRFKSSAEGGGQGAERSSGDDEEGEGGRVPAWRLRELREERDQRAARAEAAERRAEEAERRLAASERQRREAERKPRERPDLIADPDGFVGYIEEGIGERVQSVEQMVQARIIDMTFAEQDEANPELFGKAFSALKQAKAEGDPIVNRIRNAPNPGKALMRWHRDQDAIREVGGDLGAYKTKLADQLLEDETFLAKAIEKARAKAGAGGRSSATVIDLPSLNRTTGAGADRGGEGQRMSTDELFTPRRRKR